MDGRLDNSCHCDLCSVTVAKKSDVTSHVRLVSFINTVSSVLLDIFGWFLAGVATLTVAPQAVRLYRTQNPTGISPASAAMGFATMLAWSHYTLSIADIPAFASSLGPAVVWGYILGWFLVRKFTTQICLQTVSMVVIVSLFVIFDRSQYVAVAGSLTWVVPQTYKALRSTDLSGVSTAAYVLVTLENLAWIIYAAGTENLAYAVAPLVQVPLCALVAYRTAKLSRKNSDA